MSKVTTICYGKETVWSSRKKAMDFFEDCIINSEGSERDRYIDIYFSLKKGDSVASDER